MLGAAGPSGGRSGFAFGDPEPGLCDVQVAPGEVVELAYPDPGCFEGVEGEQELRWEVGSDRLDVGACGYPWLFGGPVGELDAPVAGRVGFDACVVEDELERVDVALDSPWGEPLLDELGDEVSAVLPVELGGVAVADHPGERAAVALVGVSCGGFQVVGAVEPLLVQGCPGAGRFGWAPLAAGLVSSSIWSCWPRAISSITRSRRARARVRVSKVPALRSRP